MLLAILTRFILQLPCWRERPEGCPLVPLGQRPAPGSAPVSSLFPLSIHFSDIHRLLPGCGPQPAYFLSFCALPSLLFSSL